MTTIEVVGATASGFASAFFGGGARELSTGACCSGLSNCRWPPPKQPPPPKKPPPLGRCGRCRPQNPSPKNCACADELTASSSAARPAKSTAARRAAPTSQRETRFFPVMRRAKSMGPYSATALTAMDHYPLNNGNSKVVIALQSLTRAELVQDTGRGKTVRNPATFGLEFANRSAGLKSKLTIGLADVKTVSREQLLKFQTLRPRQNTLVTWPVLGERAPAAQPVCQMSDRQGVSFGGIVFHNDTEIREHQEAWPLHAGRHQQKRMIIRSREWMAVRTTDTVTFPFADGHRPAVVGEKEIKCRRHGHLVAPRLSGGPAILFQVIGGRRNDVSYRIDDVATSVTVKVDGIAFERGRHELRRPECSGP